MELYTMDGILIFDNTNDLVYRRLNETLVNHLYELGIKDCLIQKTKEGNDFDLKLSNDVIVQIFSPLIASYKVMHGQFGQRYQSIEMEDDLILIFKKVENYVIISIRSTNKGLDTSQKEINMFSTFMKMLYGPSLYLLKDNSILINGICRQEIISRMLDEWNILKTESQMFLVEAVERLLLNPNIAALCVNLLQEVLVKARSYPVEGSFSHAFILVDGKLLALYSSRNSGQLPKKCLLLLLILSKALQSVAVNVGFTMKNLSGDANKDSSPRNDHMLGKDTVLLKSLLVFLPSQDDDVVPYVVYFLTISPKITLVLLCEITTKTTLSKHLAFLINSLDNMQNHPASRFPLCCFEILGNAFQNVVTVLEKLKQPENTEHYIKLLSIRWEQMKQFGLLEYLRDSKNKPLELRLESTVSSVCELCKVIFGEIVFLPSLKFKTSTEHDAVFLEIKRMTLKQLRDCCSYLEAKAEQNITMSSYVAEFPGLIHFIYVDRNYDCMIAPSVVLTEGHLKGRASLKKKIWNMVHFGRKYVNGANSFLCTWQHDDLRYFYSIWFENCNGKNVKPMKQVDLDSLQEKEIIYGNFFKKLTESCFPDASYDHIFCYELFCIHLVTVPSSEVIDQSRKLAAKLWDFSGIHRVSLDLL